MKDPTEAEPGLAVALSALFDSGEDPVVTALFDGPDLLDDSIFYDIIRQQLRHEARRRPQPSLARGRRPKSTARPRARARRGPRAARAGPSDSDSSDPEPGKPGLT